MNERARLSLIHPIWRHPRIGGRATYDRRVATEETAAGIGAGTGSDVAVTDALRRVAAALPAGEDRPGQLQMAQAVAAAMRDREHLVVQAGTGTGKSLAYLVPAILLGEKVVVSTA